MRGIGLQGDEHSTSWHGVGPGDVPLEAKRCRHVAVAISELRVGGGIAVSPRQEGL